MYIFAVVPFVGTWIEIILVKKAMWGNLVVPFVGTWIEIIVITKGMPMLLCRTLRGYVD